MGGGSSRQKVDTVTADKIDPSAPLPPSHQIADENDSAKKELHATTRTELDAARVELSALKTQLEEAVTKKNMVEQLKKD
eukprot:6964919-Pyramimonas_sp.AAC.1